MFGSDRSAIRLAALLEQLGHRTSLAVPEARPDRGLGRLAAERQLTLTEAPVAIASSRGLSGPGGLLGRPRSDAELTIYNTSAVARRRGDGRPRVLVLREWLDPASRRHRALCAMHRQRVDAVVAVSEGVAARWRELAGNQTPVEVCPNWLESEWLSEDATGEREGVLFLGRLNAWKGHLALADAYEGAFAASARPPSLTFAGAEGGDSPFHRAAVELGRRCEANGWRLLRFEPDPRPLLRRAALVVVPSLRPEPFGNVILEGVASGARVLAFPGGGVDDLAPLFPEAVTVVPRDVAALAEALSDWARSGARPLDAAEHSRALETVRRRFTGHAAAPRWRRVLERLDGPARA